jgi:hypothetical protein
VYWSGRARERFSPRNRWIGRFVRGGTSQTLTESAAPPLPPPAREPRIRDAFRTTEDD